MIEPLRALEGEVIEIREPRFKLLPFDRIRIGAEPPWLVKGLIPRTGLVVVWGPPKAFKSFWTFDLMMHVALGWKYRGRSVHGGPVVYCGFEGAEGIAKRAEAFRTRKLAEDSSDIPFYLVSAHMNLAKDHEELIRTIRTNLGQARPVAVVLDTLNRSLVGSESNDADMTTYIKAADAIRFAFDGAVIIVHHCGHDASRPRGHTALPGAVDAQLSVKRDGDDTVVVRVELMKDGPQGDTLVSRLESVEIGSDEDGEPLTSLVVVGAEQATKPAAPAKTKRLPDGARIALAALQKAINEAGAASPALGQIPPGVRGVSVEVWREYAYAFGISASTEARACQVAFKRGRDRLVADGVVNMWEDFVWICRDER
jgi:AAA domain